VHGDVSASKLFPGESFGKQFQSVAVQYHTPIQVHEYID
jgi:hypothetical protein